MTIKLILIGSRRKSLALVCKLFFSFLILAASCLYWRGSDWSNYYCCVDTWTHSYVHTNWARERRGISSVLVHVLSFSLNAFLGSNEISPLSLDKQASPTQSKGGQKGKEKEKEKETDFPFSPLIQIPLPSVRQSILPVCSFSIHFPQQLPFSTYTHNTSTVHIQPTNSHAYTRARHQLSRRGKFTPRK